MVGLDPISGKIRFTFGSIGLQGGFDFVTLAMGVFGLGEILYNLESTLKTEIVTTKIGKVFPTLKDWADSKWAIFRGSVIGFFSRDHPRRRRRHLVARLLCRRKEILQTS